MIAYAIGRVGQAVLVLIVVSVALFVSIYAIGNPMEILVDPEAGAAEIEAAMRRYGLDRPLWEQYAVFLGNVLRGDFGTSFVYGRPVIDLIAQRLPATLQLATVALLLTIVVAIPIGLFAGLRPRSPVSRLLMGGSILGFSLPTFWLALMMLLLFSVYLRWLPSGGRGPTVEIFGLSFTTFTDGGWKYMVMPAIALSLVKMALIMRLVRAGVRETYGADFIRFARAKGLPERRVVGVHLMRTIMIPIITVLGMELGQLIAATVVTETIFAWPGMGKLLIDSLLVLDRPVVVGVVVTSLTLVILINLAVDLLSAALDPRVRLSGAEA